MYPKEEDDDVWWGLGVLVSLMGWSGKRNKGRKKKEKKDLV